MNVYKTFLMVFAMQFSFALYAQDKAYSIEGEVQSPGIKYLYFIKGSFAGKKETKASEVAVVNGHFTITGKLDEPAPVKISSTETPSQGSFKEFILEAGQVKISIQQNVAEAKIEGSKAYDEILAYTATQTPFSDKIKSIDDEAQKVFAAGNGSDSLRSVFIKRINQAQADYVNFQKNFVRNNPDKYISLLIIPDIVKVTQRFLEADTLFYSLAPDIKSTPSAAKIKSYINSEKTLSIGAFAPDFSQADTNGRKISLSSLKGKYVLLDFWASWCGPCRQENPNVVEAYKQFKNKGFTVLGVSLDRDKKSWYAAIKNDQLTWNHVSDLKQWYNEVAMLYHIQSIPGNFLIDPKGVIIGKNLRGADLTDNLKELLSGKKK